MNVTLRVHGDDGSVSILPSLDTIQTWLCSRLKQHVDHQHILQTYVSDLLPPVLACVVIGYVADDTIEAIPDATQMIDELYCSLAMLAQDDQEYNMVGVASYATISQHIRNIRSTLDHVLQECYCVCRTHSTHCRWHAYYNRRRLDANYNTLFTWCATYYM